ncbi:hypothetical protein L596_026523 [Steinernema carpocapsae]|uniref:Serpentine receptor class gamma n=1 Tax=Steinernema carpocapsae TaxID=34508 RepID=A0A4U5M1M2_STECR|nr:hypothetical protein L596_026523 [Steinernema carpocapsae]
MELTRLLIGLPNVMIVIFSGPVHARILYVFWTRPDFYKHQCYRIMTQMEILTCLLLPYYFFIEDILGTKPDMSLAWVDAYSITTDIALACTIVTVVCYIAIVAKLIYEKLHTGYVGISSHEKRILIQAVIKFLSDFSAQMCFMAILLVEGWGGSSRLVQIFSQLADFLSMFVSIAPVLYMVLNRSIRVAVLNKKTTVNVSLT